MVSNVFTFFFIFSASTSDNKKAAMPAPPNSLPKPPPIPPNKFPAPPKRSPAPDNVLPALDPTLSFFNTVLYVLLVLLSRDCSIFCLSCPPIAFKISYNISLLE